MAWIVLVGRVLFAALFLMAGSGHLTQTSAMAGYAQSKGLPAARALVLGTGVLLVVAGLMVLLGVWGDLAALLLLVFLVPTAVVMHPFWKESDPQTRTNEMNHFLKDVAAAGASLVLLGFYASDAVGLSLTGPLFG